LVALPPVWDLLLCAKHLFVAAIATKIADFDSQLRQQFAGSKFCPLLQGCTPNSTNRSMFILPHGLLESYEGHEWFVALVVLVGLYFAVRNLMRAWRKGRRRRLTPGEVQRLEQRSHTRL
jgi:hypothetical protein